MLARLKRNETSEIWRSDGQTMIDRRCLVQTSRWLLQDRSGLQQRKDMKFPISMPKCNYWILHGAADLQHGVNQPFIKGFLNFHSRILGLTQSKNSKIRLQSLRLLINLSTNEEMIHQLLTQKVNKFTFLKFQLQLSKFSVWFIEKVQFDLSKNLSLIYRKFEFWLQNFCILSHVQTHCFKCSGKESFVTSCVFPMCKIGQLPYGILWRSERAFICWSSCQFSKMNFSFQNEFCLIKMNEWICW